MATIPWLADVLRSAGVPVVEVGGWQTRMRSGSFDPFGVLWHHTAGATSSASNPHPSLNVCINGRSDLPGPLCHALVDYNGVFHVISGGRANHAGQSGGSGPIPAGDGNAMLVGWEIDYNGVSQEMSAAQYGNSVRATAAVLKRLGRDASYARGHRETSVTGKIDPSFIDLNRMRSDVANAMRRGSTTVGWYRNSDSSFHLRNALSNGDTNYAFVLGPGNSGDIIPVVGDWDGTGTSTVGWYRPSDSSWHLRNSLSGGDSNYAFVFGPPNSGGVFPVTGDWNGDGRTSVGWYRASDSSWHLKNSLSGGASDLAFVFGPPNSGGIVPVTGDWNGDGRTTIGWYRNSDSSFHLRDSLSNGDSNYAFVFGPPNSGGIVPVTGDWDRNGRTSVGWYRNSDSSFHLRNALSNGDTNYAFVFGPPNSGGIVPVTGDWDRA